MNVKRNVKKVFAMATGVALMGATMAGALAYDLGDYPQPFVDKDSGAFNGAVVVGEDAATMDVVGAIDIAASLQAQATKDVTVEGSTAVSVEGGEEIETFLNTPFNKSLDDYDLEGFKEGTVDVNDNDYDFEEEFTITNGVVATSISSSFDDYEDKPYLELPAESIRYDIIFDNGDGIPASAIDADELEVSFLGTTLKVIDYDNGTNEVTVEASNERVLEEGDSIDIDGHTVVLRRVGSDSVIVEVDGQSKVIGGGDTKTFDDAGDYKVEVESGSIFYIEGADDNMATLRVGSSLTDTFQDGDALEIFGGTDTTTEASWLWTVENSTDNLAKLGVRSNMPYDRVLDDPRARERNALAMGEELELPGKYAAVSFAGWTSSGMDRFATLEGYFDEVLLDGFDERTEVFVLTSDAEKIFEIAGKNVQEVYYGGNSTAGLTFYYEDNDGDIIAGDSSFTMDLSDVVTIEGSTNASTPFVNVTIGDDEVLELDTNLTAKQFGSSEDDQGSDIVYTGASEVNATSDVPVKTTYGVYWDDFQGMADANEFLINVPYEQQEALVTVTSKGSSVSAGGEGGVYDEVQPIGVGLGMLDTDAAASLGDKPMIVVGGPSINTVAMELMDNPTPEQIAETFSEGKAMIKWYDDQLAMLVAGWEAEETHQAAQVLVSRADELSGDEVEVSVVGDVQDAEINPVE